MGNGADGCKRMDTKMDHLIPKPVSVTRGSGDFRLRPTLAIAITPDAPTLRATAELLAETLRAATGYVVPVAGVRTGRPGEVTLQIDANLAAAAPLGEEGYRIAITPDHVHLVAAAPAGLFYAVQTLRQLLPPFVPAPGTDGLPVLPAGAIEDYPRFAWRGAMLDVARHFFGVEAIKRYIDLLALYKFNRLHLHLADDQGWRIEIKSWPQLAAIGGSTSVNNDGGGYYTQAQYQELVAYAARRCITIVPEIDLPGHTNAALASYAELNCDGVARPLYTGIEVGFSSLCIDKELTYQFLDDVLGELAALTPGPYLHIGGDEAHATPPADYARFMRRVQPLVAKYGKQVVAWEEIGQVDLLPGVLVQRWNMDPAHTAHTLQAVAQGARVIMSPANRTYLDMKYTADTPLGLQWAGLIEVRDAYDWDPGTYLAGVDEADIAGIEAPIWAETLRTIDEVLAMAFPRLPGIAELGWSPAAGRAWAEYRTRLAAHAPGWEAHGIRYHRSPQVDW
jgi:hexosaminidase